MSYVLTPKSADSITLSEISYPITIRPNITTTVFPSTYSPSYSTLALTPTQTYTSVSTFPVVAVKPTVYVDIDTGLNDSYVVQKDVTKYFMYKALDKWLYSDYRSALKMLVYKGGKVELIKKLADKDNNDISKDSEDALEAKADYIEEKVLTEMKTRAILIRIMKELGFKWFELPYKEELVKEVIGKYIKKKLTKMIEGEDYD